MSTDDPSKVLRAKVAAATQGPWYANLNDLIGGWVVANADKRSSALDAKRGEHEVADFMDEVNARLVAKTPEAMLLLADVWDHLEVVRQYGGDHDGSKELAERLTDFARSLHPY